MINFYALPLKSVMIIIAVLIFCWICGDIVFGSDKSLYRQVWINGNRILCILEFMLIIKMTLFGRTTGSRELELWPFYTLTTIAYNNEAIRTMVMNVILFLPFGLTLPYIFTKIRNNYSRWMVCIFTGFLISVVIETIQYYFGLGRAETDDVICNTFGCTLGVLADVLADFWESRKT